MRFCLLAITFIVFSTSQTMSQVNYQLPLEASNCAIYRALNTGNGVICRDATDIGLSRGIVLRIDEELKKQQQQDIKSNVVAPKIVTPKRATRTTKTASLSPQTPHRDRGAAKPKNGYFIQFSFDSFDLEPEFVDHLNRLADVLSTPEMLNTCIRVTGHTDTSGSAEYNKKLSQNRAVMVATKLAELGNISPERIQIAAAGEEKPLSDIDGEDPLNRRVEFSTKEATNGCSA